MVNTFLMSASSSRSPLQQTGYPPGTWIRCYMCDEWAEYGCRECWNAMCLTHATFCRFCITPLCWFCFPQRGGPHRCDQPDDIVMSLLWSYYNMTLTPLQIPHPRSLNCYVIGCPYVLQYWCWECSRGVCQLHKEWCHHCYVILCARCMEFHDCDQIRLTLQRPRMLIL